MNRYLERLRTVIASSEGFEGDAGMRFSKNVGLNTHEKIKTPIPHAPSKPSKSFVRGSATVYSAALKALESRCPDYVPHNRWQQCVADADMFLGIWGRQACTIRRLIRTRVIRGYLGSTRPVWFGSWKVGASAHCRAMSLPLRRRAAAF